MLVHLTSAVSTAIIRRMSPWARRLSPLAVLIYAAVLVWIFSLEFEGFHRVEHNHDGVSLSAWILPGNEYRTGRIMALNVSTDWFETRLGLWDSVTLRRSGGARESVRPLSIHRDENGFRVRFEQDFELIVTSEPEDEPEIVLEVVVPEQRSQLLGLELPLSPTEASRFRRTANGQALTMEEDHQQFSVTFPSDATYDAVNRRAVLAGKEGTYEIRAKYQEAPDEGTLASWFDGTVSEVSDRDLEETVSEFIDRAFTVWREARYSPEHGTWTFADGGDRFDERVALALLAEAWTRNDYARVRSQMRNAQSLHMDSTSYRLAGYLGELGEYREAMHDEINDELEQISELVDDNDADVFLRDDPWTNRSVFNFAETHAGPGLLSQLLELAGSVDLSSLEFPQLLALYEARYYYPDTEQESTHEQLNRLDNRIEDLLLPRVRNTENGFFIETGEQRANVAASLRAGQVILAAAPSDDSWIQLGRRLVRDALNLFDPDLHGPGSLHLDGMSIVDVEGSTDAIDMYPYISTNPRLPSVISPPSPFADEGFVWTIADVSDIQVSEDRMSFTITGAPDRTHHLFVHGVPSVSRVSMFGLDNWRDDSNFERYSRGRHYDEETGTVGIKYTSEQRSSTVEIHY